MGFGELSNHIYGLGIIQDGAKGHLQRLRIERGGQDEQLFYIPKCIYIDRFATRDRNKVNWSGVWELTCSVIL